ncbi:MAG: hypothetical protein N2513_07860 [Deltaproteobacteria bacterium]|nr:hypothetical protein [Deltaproteobacteria bacterium]
MLLKIETQHKKKCGKDIKVKATPPIKGVEFAYALHLSKCIGCRRCVYACVRENNLSRSPHQVYTLRVLRFKKRINEFFRKQITTTIRKAYRSQDTTIVAMSKMDETIMCQSVSCACDLD